MNSMYTLMVNLLLIITSVTLHDAVVAPPQPTDVDASYRSGQTFITWTENAAIVGESYRIYRSDQPITSANLTGATLLHEVWENSARFYGNRYRNYESPPVWRDRYVENYVIEDHGSELSAGTGLLVWTLSLEDFQGGSSGNSYYAITTIYDGVENITDFSSANTAGPVAESIAAPQPVALLSNGSWHSFIQYMDLDNWNPTFHAPRSYNSYYGVDAATPGITQSIQYAYDYAVFVPETPQCGGEVPDTLPVLLDLHAWQGNVYPAPSNPVDLCAYVIHPFDVSETWWFGFARDYDFRLGGVPGAGDAIANYTEQRLLQMISDLIRVPVGPAVDIERIYVKGHSMGGSGALALALRYPDVFAAAYASKPMTNYREAGGWVGSVAAKWGNTTSELPVSLTAPPGWGDHLPAYDGNSVWDWQNHQLNLATRFLDPMVPFGMDQGINDTSISWATQGAPLYLPLNASHQLWGVSVTDDGHNAGNYRGLPPNLQMDAQGVPFAGMQVRRCETVPGIANASANLSIAPEITPTSTGGYQQTIRWSASWDNWDNPPLDLDILWQMSLCTVDPAVTGAACGTGISQTLDLTPRRVQTFTITPDTSYFWRNRAVAGDTLLAGGLVTASSDGLITLDGVSIPTTGSRITLAPVDGPFTATVNITTSGQGSVEALPDTAYYELGQRVTFTANAAQNWAFEHWETDVTGNENTVTRTITGTLSVKAVFVFRPKVYLPTVLRGKESDG